MRHFLAIYALLACLPLFAEDAAAPEPLPEGDKGLAAKYAGDVGIEKDSAVLFCDNFEDASNINDLRKKWDAAFQDQGILITQEPANVHGGKKAAEMIVPKQDKEYGNCLGKQLKEERDVVFLRYYAKYEKGYDAVGSMHDGSVISAHYNKDGRATPGIPADGKNKFLCGFENNRFDEKTTPPGELNIYCYHAEQKSEWGDHFFPSGTVSPGTYDRSGAATFGKHFVPRKDITLELDRWYCFEFMVKANAVGKRDGRIACWLDGKLIADFPNMRFRDIESLKIDRVDLGLYIHNNTKRENKKWYDDVVVATQYIGPMATKKK